MTKREFTKMAQRILIAFALSSDFPFTSKKFRKDSPSDVQYFFMCEANGLEIKVWIYDTSEIWGIQIFRNNEDHILCSEWPDNPSIVHDKCFPEYAPLLARAMYLLGFDISPVETELNLAISAHEKLEWQLEFARRMREDARENGA